MAQKKAIVKKHIVLGLFVITLCAFLFGFFYDGVQGYFRDKKLSECTGHDEGNVHIHATLEIYFQNRKMPVSQNVGVTSDCIHPVHTHETEGLLHVDYPTDYPFTLGDFFSVWGYIFNKDQLANIRTIDGYEIVMTVNDAENKEFENLVIGDQDTIRIDVVEK